jgi:lysophospholipase L1-like esterase
MLQFEDPPSYLVVHVGGNDIGKEKIGYLRNNLKLFLRTIQRKLPNTIIVWSQILPSRSYRFSTNNKPMGKCRYHLNNSIAKIVVEEMEGRYIRHPELIRSWSLFEDDGVHVTSFGNNLFLSDLQTKWS